MDVDAHEGLVVARSGIIQADSNELGSGNHMPDDRMRDLQEGRVG